MPLGKLSHQCALMEVTYHLADAFYYGTGADPLKQHGIKCLAERLDCVRLHLETQQFVSTLPSIKFVTSALSAPSLNHQTVTHRGNDWLNCLT